jgi:hypothetical protein
MKKIVLLLIVMAAGFLNLQAQEDNRLVISAAQMKNISLGDNMNVVLVSAQSSASEMKGADNVFERLNVAYHNGSMHVAPGRQFQADETVYVIVNDLKSLTIGQNTKVNTEGILYSNVIRVYVQDGSLARLRTTGDVKAYSLDDLEYSIRKTPIRYNASR